MRPRSAPNFLRRLGRNLKHNRFFLIYAGQLFIFSKHLSRENSLRLQEALNSPRRPPLSVYRAFCSLTRTTITADSTALFHSHLGRFGNAVTEIIGSIKLARVMDVGHVILDGHNVFATSGDLSSAGRHKLSSGVQVWIDTPETPKKLRTILHIKGSGRMLGSLDCTAIWKEADGLFGFDSPPTGDPGTLTIHLRGGDVFGERDVRNYGQPPFCFYQKILESSPWVRVHLVSEDNVNPVLSRISDYCGRRGIEFIWSRQSLKTDLQTLFAARNLVASRGTFIPAVVGLSKNIRRVYFFEDKFVMQPPKSGIELWKVEDSGGFFKEQVLSGNWENSSSQRALMVEYPEENLSLKKLR